MQSVHESFTNYEFHESPELACADRLLRTTNFTNLTDWLVQTGFYEHEYHESHELIIMTTNLTNWLVAQGRITG